jgi:hypothetical protein
MSVSFLFRIGWLVSTAIQKLCNIEVELNPPLTTPTMMDIILRRIPATESLHVVSTVKVAISETSGTKGLPDIVIYRLLQSYNV